jgi:FkbM family methyltransferase
MKYLLSETLKLGKFPFQHPFNTSTRLKLKSALRIIQWMLISRIHNGPIISSFVEDSVITLARGISARETYFHPLNEPYEMSFLLHLAGEDCTFLDIGANAGSYTLLACIAGSNAVSIEPAPLTYNLLCQNIRLNNYSDKVTALQVAIGRQKGTCFMQKSAGPTNRVTEDGRSAPIEMTTLNDLIKDQQKFYIIKIDVEGYEEEVLRGGQEALISPNVLAVIIESAGNEKNYKKDENNVPKMLNQAGFQAFTYDPFERKITPSSRQISENVIYIKDAERIQKRISRAPKFRVGHQLI